MSPVLFFIVLILAVDTNSASSPAPFTIADIFHQLNILMEKYII